MNENWSRIFFKSYLELGANDRRIAARMVLGAFLFFIAILSIFFPEIVINAFLFFGASDYVADNTFLRIIIAFLAASLAYHVAIRWFYKKASGMETGPKPKL